VDLLLQQQVSGIVFVGGLYAQEEAPHEHYALLARRRLPTVLVNAAVKGLDFPCVSCDDSVAIEQAMGHLLSLGHSRIGVLIGPPDHVPSQRKLAAARAVAARAGVTLGPDQIAHSHYSLEGAQAAAMRLLEAGVSGIVCASDPMALGAIRAAKRTGLNVPRDVSVVGFDDSALMNSIDPPLTTVRQPIEPMCRMIIELLVGQIEGTSLSHDELLFEPELVVRGSTAPPSTTR
jgi:DNA-binding LacI/PurR family transcriptional regulator